MVVGKKFKFLGAEGLGKEVAKGVTKYNGFFGVGLASDYYSFENLELYAKWASENFESFIFLLADDIERYNLIVFEDVSEKDAFEKSRDIGDEKFKLLEQISKKYKNVSVERWNDFSSSKDFRKILKILKESYKTVPMFREQIQKTLWSNRRAKLELLESDVGEAKFKKSFEILVNYSLEEVAMIIYLGEIKGYQVKLGHKGERVYDNIVDRIYGRTYDSLLYSKLSPKNRRGNIYFQIE